ncbi:MAG: lipopolysaccharide heptosyltransferase II [Candidatus Omnitrophica bacterium]|nr:lipopolysaccharide heptosyltransferase II [Candidatus Omnitrophota bacterium]
MGFFKKDHAGSVMIIESERLFRGEMLGIFPRYVFKSRWKRWVMMLLDLGGYILVFPFSLFRKKVSSDCFRRILVIRLDHIGDVTMTKPALEALCRAFPTSEIDLLVSHEIKPLFEDSRGIRQVIGMDDHWFSRQSNLGKRVRSFIRAASMIRKKNYDLAIDFRGDLRNILLMFSSGIPYRLGYAETGGGFLLTEKGNYSRDLHQMGLNLRLLERFGVNPNSMESPYTYSQEKKERFWRSFGSVLEPKEKLRIVIHPYAGYPSKEWPHENYETLIDRMVGEGVGQVVVIGSERDKMRYPLHGFNGKAIVDLRGKTRLEDLPILFDHCDLFIGNDSGPSHLAAAQGIPCVCLFSGTNPWQAWHPVSRKLYLLSHTVSCSPCEEKTCPLGHHDCMNKMTVDEVVEKVRLALGSKDHPSMGSGASGSQSRANPAKEYLSSREA